MGNSLHITDLTKNIGTTHEVVTPNGSFTFNVTADDLSYLPAMVKKAEEFIRKCGYPHFRITQKQDDPYDFNQWEWSNDPVN